MKRREPQLGAPEENTKAALSLASSPPGSSSSDRENSESLTPVDTFGPRRSTRVSTKKYSHDGDSWQEKLAVCEMPKTPSGTIKMTIRSYYSNQRSGERVWDEPPSGASRVLPATEEMRKMAEIQLQEMQISFGGIAEPESKEKPKKKGFFRRAKVEKEDADTRHGKIQYKPGSFLSRVKKESSNKIERDDTLDPELQKAIALSMADGGYQRAEANQDPSEPVIRSEVNHYRDDEETLAMAMALSLSELESSQVRLSEDEDGLLQRTLKESKRVSSSSKVKAELSQTYVPLTEEEMFQRALEASKRATSSSKVASLPVFRALDSSMSSSTDENSPRLPAKEPADDLSDKKMPAKPSMPRGALGQSVRKKPVGTNDLPRSMPTSYERSSSGGSWRYQAKNESMAKDSRESTVRVIPGSSDRSDRSGSSRRASTKNNVKNFES